MQSLVTDVAGHRHCWVWGKVGNGRAGGAGASRDRLSIKGCHNGVFGPVDQAWQYRGSVLENFAIIMVLASFVAGIYGLINWAKPLGFLKITQRWQGAAIFGGAFISFWVFAFVGAASQPGGLSASTPTETETAISETETAEPPVKKDGISQEEFNAVWSQVKREMERCDAPLRVAGRSLETGDVYTAFGPVKTASDACEKAWLDMGRIDIPKSAKGDAKKAIKEALDTCNTSIYLKRESMKQLQTVLDGDVRPSVMDALKDKMDRGTGLTTKCTYDFMSAASQAGLILPEIQEALDKAKSD